MQIPLSPEFEAFARDMVARGAAKSVEDVAYRAMDSMRLRAEIQAAIDSLDRGEGIPLEQVFSELEQRYRSKIS